MPHAACIMPPLEDSGSLPSRTRVSYKPGHSRFIYSTTVFSLRSLCIVCTGLPGVTLPFPFGTACRLGDFPEGQDQGSDTRKHISAVPCPGGEQR